MEPIISPVWIYLINFASKIQIFSILISVAALFVWVSVYVGAIEFYGEEEKSEELRRKWLQNFAIIMIVCVLIFMIIPDKDTMYEMLAASIITPDNISGGEDYIINLIAKIANIIYNTPK